jgi:hypothetical protein
MFLSTDQSELVLSLPLGGNSISSVEHVTEVHDTTILKLSVLAGENFERIMAEKIRNVQVRDAECDEVWSFIGKSKSVCGLMAINCWAVAMSSLGSSITRNWFSTSRWANAITTTDAFVEGLRPVTAGAPFQTQPMDSRGTVAPSLPRFATA